jgi:5-methylcytosine-specific restriction enzyme A
MPATRFEIGRRYRRRKLHDQYGGQRQGGTSTPRDHPFIMLITGKSGTAYGYHDGWEDSGTFRYFGHGQVGDMQFVSGNRAIRDHAADGRELHLFEDVGRGFIRYVSEMTCAGYEWVADVNDVDGNPRRAIAFQLVPVEAIEDRPARAEDDEPADDGFWSRSLEDLRNAALEAPDPTESSAAARRRVWVRSRALRIYVLRRSNGACEACGDPAPFTTPNGRPFLEAHHTRRLSDGGPDDPRWVIAVCPNCHRRAHHATDATTFNESLQSKLGSLEGATA